MVVSPAVGTSQGYVPFGVGSTVRFGIIVGVTSGVAFGVGVRFGIMVGVSVGVGVGVGVAFHHGGGV